MKVAGACVQCRAGKRKCTPSPTEAEACQQCKQRRLPCSRLTLRRRQSVLLQPRSRTVEGSNGHEEAEESVSLPAMPALLEMVDLYFRYLHDQPHSLFHESTFRQEVVESRAPPIVLYAMIGLSARFLPEPRSEPRLMGEPYSRKARGLLNLEDICLANVQACILIGNLCFGGSHPVAESIYFGIAIRMAQILRLGEEDPLEADSIVRETKRRVWWSLFLIDRWASAGVNTSCSIRNGVSPYLPMAELAFRRLTGSEQDEHPRPLGLWAHMITLIQIWDLVQDLNKLVVTGQLQGHEIINQRVSEISAKFESWAAELPPETQYSPQNLENHRQNGLGRTFVALHLGYHHYATLLFFQFLDGQRHPFYVQKCKYHATAVSSLISSCISRPGIEPLYNIVGHIVVVSSSVHLHSLLFGEENETVAAKMHLESNFEALLVLRKYWASVDIMTSRLRTFQDTCRMSMDNTYKMDNWLLKFLLQHALILDEKSYGNNVAQSSPSGRTPRIAPPRQRLRSDGDLIAGNALSWLLDQGG